MDINGKGARLAVTAGLAAALTLGGVAPAVQAFAATTTGSITIESTQNYTVKGDYDVFQLFTGSFTTDAQGHAHMGDVEADQGNFGHVVNTLNDLLPDDQKVDVTGDISDDRAAIAVTDAIAGLNSVQAQAFANNLAGLLQNLQPYKTVAAQNGTLNVTGLPTGYYLVINPAANGARTSAVLVPVDGDKNVDIKASTPTVTKQAKVGNGEYGDNNDVGLIDSKTWEAITYKIEGTVANNIDDYTTYKYTFQDTLPTTVTPNADRVAGWSVKIAATLGDKSADVTAAFSTTTNGNQVTWSCTDLIAALKTAGFNGSLADAKITLTYTPDYTVDELRGALAGDVEGATNTVKLIYSNNPYDGGTGESSSDTEDTPQKESKVYTYEIAIAKVKESGDVLEGAGFTLQRDGKDIFTDQMTDEHGMLIFTGLDSGVEYTLIESTTPAGMKSIDPIKFTINATKDANGAVTKVEATEDEDNSNAADFADDNTADSVIKVKVTNIEGADLPLTGQQGIIAGVAVGGIVIAASLVAVVRNRKQAE